MLLGLRLTIEGEAACKWNEFRGRSSVNYRGEEKYLNSVTYLFGSKDGESMEVEAGYHTYHFECHLPSQIPHSVEGDYGYVRYKVTVNLDIPWAFNLKTEKAFKVVRHEDLNFFPELRLPCALEETKVFCCLCCKSGPLILKVCLPKTGFAWGENIPICVEMINRSRTDVSHTTIKLKRVDTFISQLPFESKKFVELKLDFLQCRGAKAGETVAFEELLQIPPVCVISNNRYCKVFQITYEVRVNAEIGGISVSPKVLIPITIGTVGLSDGFKIAVPNICLSPAPNDMRKKYYLIKFLYHAMI